VDISKFQKVDRQPVPGRILYVGSMIPRKGLDLLVDALPYITSDFELRIVGNGSKEEIEMLKAAAKQKGVLDKLTFCGFLQGEKLTDEYRKAQVFVLPTREDCFGLVLLEAMCAGVPIVASKYADGAYDTVLEGQNGYIADPFASVDLARAIDCVLAGGEMHSADIKRVEKFTFSSVSEAYVQAVKYVL
jgi:glycosyltransferase involved in cell wall biosynthesis